MMTNVKNLVRVLIPSKYHQRTGAFYEQKMAPIMRKLQRHEVSFEKIMLGDEASMQATKYSRITENLMRPSTRVEDGPHVQLLKDYDKFGDAILSPARFVHTAYYNNAIEVLDVVGNYFESKDDDEIVVQAKRLIELYSSFDINYDDLKQNIGLGHSPSSLPIIVRKIADSSGAVQLVDGHHRAAVMFCKGYNTCPVYTRKEAPVHTPLQQLVLDGLWTQGEKVLYQPIETAEFDQSWKRPRKCIDRFKKMERWLETRIPKKDTQCYIDLGSSYGWFVSKMLLFGFESYGVERDPFAIKTGEVAYGLDADRIYKQELSRFLQKCNRTFDVVSCFSVLHHFAMGRANISAEELIKRIDSITGEVLFFDTGQGHENWFENELGEWSDQYIPEWIIRHSSFRNVQALGRDEDSVVPYEDNYGRMLYVCTR